MTGKLEPLRQVEVGSQVSGTIASLPADFNARVTAGQVLARLDQASFHASLAEAEAGLATGTTGLVTYVAVIEVDAPDEEIPPGGTAIVTLAGSQRQQAVRIPNNALTYAPSADALTAVNQDPPVLDRAGSAPAKQAGTRQGYVWKFENNRFVPIAVQTGISDDSWTEVVSGAVRPGDALVTAAVAVKRRP